MFILFPTFFFKWNVISWFVIHSYLTCYTLHQQPVICAKFLLNYTFFFGYKMWLFWLNWYVLWSYIYTMVLFMVFGYSVEGILPNCLKKSIGSAHVRIQYVPKMKMGIVKATIYFYAAGIFALQKWKIMCFWWTFTHSTINFHVI